MMRIVVAALLVGFGCSPGDTAPCDREVDELVAEAGEAIKSGDDDEIRTDLASMVDDCPDLFDQVMEQVADAD